MANIELSQKSDYFLQDESTRPKSGEYHPLIFGKEGDDTIVVFDGWAIGGAGNDLLEARKLLLSDYATLAYIDSPTGIFLDLR